MKFGVKAAKSVLFGKKAEHPPTTQQSPESIESLPTKSDDKAKSKPSKIKQALKLGVQAAKVGVKTVTTTAKIVTTTAKVSAKVLEVTSKPLITTVQQVASLSSNEPKKIASTRNEWLKDLGAKVLAKIYEPNATPGNPEGPGSIVESFPYAFAESGLGEKENARSVYHQANRQSLTKIVKEINRFVRGDDQHVKARQNYLTQIVSIVWAAQEQAKQNGDDFERGSIKIKDPDGKLFAFFKGYVQFATGKESVGYLFSSNDFAYNRNPKQYLSSHYTQFETEQYGIDMRFTGAAPTLDVLPNKGDSHLLFGRVKINGQWQTFIKAEPIGLGHPLEYLEHTRNFLIPQKHAGVKRKESEIPKPIKEAYRKFCQAQGVTEVHTLSDMYQQVMRSEMLSTKASTARTKFFEALKQHNFTQDILIRTGNEVIIDFGHYQPVLNKPLPVMANHPSVNNSITQTTHVTTEKPSKAVAIEVKQQPIAHRLRSANVKETTQVQQQEVPLPIQKPISQSVVLPRNTPLAQPKPKQKQERKVVVGINMFSALAMLSCYGLLQTTSLGVILGPSLTVFSAVFTGFLTANLFQQARKWFKNNALKQFESAKNLSQDEVQVFEYGMQCATSYRAQMKSCLWLPAYTNLKAYYAGMKAVEANQNELIDKVLPQRLR